VVLIACKNSKQARMSKEHTAWTEEKKRRFFIDSLAYNDKLFPPDTGNSKIFKAFMDKNYPVLQTPNKYNPFIYALEEPYIDTTKIDAAKHWFRLSVQPSFGSAYCFVIEKQENKTFLITKMTNGNGGYLTGTLALYMKVPFSDTLYNNLLQKLQDLKFYSLPPHDTSCGLGLDGETWTFELLDGGKYRLLGRWSPEHCGNSETKQLGQIGLRIKKLSRLDRVLAAVSDKNSGR
jgi:hypothetical protein